MGGKNSVPEKKVSYDSIVARTPVTKEKEGPFLRRQLGIPDEDIQVFNRGSRRPVDLVPGSEREGNYPRPCPTPGENQRGNYATEPQATASEVDERSVECSELDVEWSPWSQDPGAYASEEYTSESPSDVKKPENYGRCRTNYIKDTSEIQEVTENVRYNTEGRERVARVQESLAENEELPTKRQEEQATENQEFVSKNLRVTRDPEETEEDRERIHENQAWMLTNLKIVPENRVSFYNVMEDDDATVTPMTSGEAEAVEQDAIHDPMEEFGHQTCPRSAAHTVLEERLGSSRTVCGSPGARARTEDLDSAAFTADLQERPSSIDECTAADANRAPESPRRRAEERREEESQDLRLPTDEDPKNPAMSPEGGARSRRFSRTESSENHRVSENETTQKQTFGPLQAAVRCRGRSPSSEKRLSLEGSGHVTLSGSEMPSKLPELPCSGVSRDDWSQISLVSRDDWSQVPGVLRNDWSYVSLGLKDDSSQDLGALRDDSFQALKVLRDDRSQNTGMLREDSSQDPGLVGDDSSQDLGVLRDDSSQNDGMMRDDSSQALEVLRDDSSQDLEVLRDDRSQNAGMLREDSSQDLGLVGDDSSQDLGVLRDDSSQKSGMMRDDSSQDQEVLRDDRSQNAGMLREDSSQDLGLVGDDSSQDLGVPRGDSSQNAGMMRDDSSQDQEVLRGDRSQNAGMLKENISQNLVLVGDDSSQDLGVPKDDSSQNAEMMREDSSQALEVLRDDNSQDLEVLRDDRSQNAGMLREDISQDLVLVGDDSSQDLGVPRDDSSQNAGMMRDDSSQALEVLRDDSSQVLGVLRDDSSQALRVPRNVLIDGSSRYPPVLRDDRSQDPRVLRDDRSQYPGVLRDDRSQDPGVLRDDRSQDPGVLRDKSQDPGVLRDCRSEDPGVLRDDISQHPGDDNWEPRASGSAQNIVVPRQKLPRGSVLGEEGVESHHKKRGKGKLNLAVRLERDRIKHKLKRTAVYVKIADPLREDFDISGYIAYRLPPGIEFEVTDRAFERETENTLLTLQCPSKRVAQRLKAELEKGNRRSRTNILCFDTLQEAEGHGLRPWRVAEESWRKHIHHIQQRSQAALEAHYAKITDTESRLEAIRSSKGKFMSIEDYKTKCSERRALEDKEKELNLQKEEFLKYLGNALSELNKAKESKGFENFAVRTRLELAIEYNRLANSFPIYARRSDILRTVRENQVSIIIGETGSGKSTQMAQYFCQAGLADGGMIACTQPRKIAATTLAVHVAKEMGTAVGELIGYKVGMQIRKSNSTKILYMTDHVLLNECLQDRKFSAYSCIIVDEAHERSIYTDLLLGLIKDCLPDRPDLRVVITSATINPETFVRYFKQCPVLFVSGRMFPVEVEWKETVPGADSFDNYEEQCVRKALAVHQSQGPGDVLVFLTSPLETEKCCGRFRDMMEGRPEDFVTLPLHGRLQGDEQQKVFDPPPVGKRKIVFATNSAETSVTIPGIKYVIDTGLVKEAKFDPVRKISTLAVGMVTQSSAKQRMGRAGRLGPGRCYRLYTQEDFQKMNVDSLPEILRVHIGHAILKLMELGVDPMGFDYIMSPPEEAMLEAFASLVAIGAVANKSITERGRWIAKVPFDPKYGAFVYDAVQAGAALEAIVIAAGSGTGSFFYRGGTNEDKEKADKLKVQFCHEGGDQLTMLNVFREWHKVPEREKGRWCFNHYINGKAVKTVRETTNEVLHTLKKELNIQIKFSLDSPENVDGMLVGLLFKALSQNLSHYLGHSKAGYNVVYKEQRVEVHPSSALLSLADHPEWIVFDQVMRTSRDFAMQVLPVPESLVVRGNEEGWLQLQIEEVKKNRIVVANREFVGTQMFREFVGPRYVDLRNLETRLASECPGALVIVEANRDKGELQVLSDEKSKNSFNDSLAQLTSLRSKFELEESEERLGLKTADSSVRAVIGAGGCTVNVFMPDEYSVIMINCAVEMIEELSEEDVLENFGHYGKIKECKKFFRKHKSSVVWGKVFYEKTESAIKAVRATKDCPDLKAVPGCRIPVQAINGFRTKIQWCRRPSKGFGFVEFAEVENRLEALRLASILVGGSYSRIKRARNSPQSVHVSGFNQLVTEDVLRDAFVGALSIDPEKDIVKVTVVRERVDLNKELLNIMKMRLLSEIQRFAEPNKFHLDLREPRSATDTRFTAFCVFNSPEEGHRACTELNNGFTLNGNAVTMKADLYSSVFIHKNVYKKSGEELMRQIQGMENENKEIRIRVKHLKSENVVVDLHTENVNVLARVRSAIQEVIRGDTIDCENNPTTLSLFTRDGRKTLQTIMARSGTLIMTDDRVLTVSIHGLQADRLTARVLIDQYLEQVSHENFKNVELKGGGKPPGVMKTLMIRFGTDLVGLQTEAGLSAVTLDHRNHRLRVMGTEEAINKAVDVVSEVIQSLTVDGAATENEDDPECVTCFCPVELNELYRLECCGHPYCKECIRLQMDTAINGKDFPIVCGEQDCSSKFVWRDFVNLSRGGHMALAKLANASLSTFVSQHKDEFHYCTTPDCPIVYRVTEIGTPFVCPECGLKICTSCHIQYHDGLSCAMYKSMKDDGGSLSDWLRQDTHSRKICTSCRTPIEKIEGCNKMHCLGCKKYLCWKCMAFFDTEQECYGHLQKEHGSFY